MDRLIRILIDRLTGQGLEVTFIPAFIRNLAHSIIGNPDISLEDLNSRLRLLGWGNITVDSYTLSLILAIWDSGNCQMAPGFTDTTEDKGLLHQIPSQREMAPEAHPSSAGG
ncbi:MAG: hypothetical protein V2J25_05330 [Desulfatiglans sp.]|jgi:hypothetical protein|nr:hypothetical protein [Thermodesulfobacteriota bacterium]MEE4352274.1 hypothetical protein [Desulfatiglans sp.]